jgi:CheY-like chemotaxis protein
VDIDLPGLDGLTAAEQLGSDSTQQLWIPISAATFGPDTRSTVHEEPLVELSRDERLGFEPPAKRGAVSL